MDREEILKEQYFKSIGVGIEERDFLLDLLSKCKDISDSEYGSDRSGSIIELSMERCDKDLIHISGSVAYKHENRIIVGDILYHNNNVIFNTRMTRLCIKDNMKDYLVLDKFIKTENGYNLLSHYNCENMEYKKEIVMKGKVK